MPPSSEQTPEGRVAAIKKHSAIGGACINTGTIPSKTMREAVLHLSGFYSKNFYAANHTAAENITMAYPISLI